MPEFGLYSVYWGFDPVQGLHKTDLTMPNSLLLKMDDRTLLLVLEHKIARKLRNTEKIYYVVHE